MITASLASGTGPLEGTTTATLSGGVAAFRSLADDTAATISLQFTSGGLNPVVAGPIVVAARPATRLLVTTSPPSTLSPGQAFSITVAAEDPFQNVDSSYTGDVTITLAGDSRFTIAVQPKNGVATFTGLTLPASAGAVTIQVTAPGLSATATNPITVNPITVVSPPPTIIGESVVMKKTMKNGKPVGKLAFAGFEIDFSTVMNSSNAALTANYLVVSKSTKRHKKQTVTVFKPVGFKAAYQQANNVSSVILSIKSRKAIRERRPNYDRQYASERSVQRERGRPRRD